MHQHHRLGSLIKYVYVGMTDTGEIVLKGKYAGEIFCIYKDSFHELVNHSAIERKRNAHSADLLQRCV